MTDSGYTMMCEQSRPDRLVQNMFGEAGGADKPRVGQIAVSYDPDSL
jgi:hypothetical protein